MADSYEAIIDFAERKYGCRVAGLGTDDDSGSKAGRDIVEERRPWLFTFPCGAHHVRILILLVQSQNWLIIISG